MALEALACVYLPLLELLDGAPVTVGPRPAGRSAQASRGEAGERYLRFLREVRAPIDAEDVAGLDAGGGPLLAAELRCAAEDDAFAERAFDGHGRDLVGAFRGPEGIELWTSAATTPVLPLLATDAGIRLQLATGIASQLAALRQLGRRNRPPESRTRPGSSATWPIAVDVSPRGPDEGGRI